MMGEGGGNQRKKKKTVLTFVRRPDGPHTPRRLMGVFLPVKKKKNQKITVNIFTEPANDF